MPLLDRLQLVPQLRRVNLAKNARLEIAGAKVGFVYFVDEGVVSLSSSLSGRCMGVGLVGREGMVGTSVLYGVDVHTTSSLVLVPGFAWRIAVSDFAAVLATNPSLVAFLNLYLCCELMQAGSTALAAGRAKLEARLARLLLMLDDRAEGSWIQLTHDTIADELGVRRPGISTTFNILKERDLVQVERGYLQIKNRSGLVDMAKPHYGGPEEEYARLLGRFPRR